MVMVAQLCNLLKIAEFSVLMSADFYGTEIILKLGLSPSAFPDDLINL